MQFNVIWQGLEYGSLENCIISSNNDGNSISSTVIGHYEQCSYMVQYVIKTNRLWETLLLDISIQHSNQKNHLVLRSDGKGRWFSDGKVVSEYEGCTEPDISITPLTNTLPIKRLKMVERACEIQVLYLDVFGFKIYPARQRYAHRSGHIYHFETVPNDFEADISLNESGIVMDYPSLFRCLDITMSHDGKHGSSD